MANFITNQIISALNQKIGAIGQISDLDFSRNSVSITLDLAGEENPVRLEAHGLCYDVSGGKMNLYFDKLICRDKIWVQEIFKMLAEKTGRVISFPDNAKLLPLKMLLKKRA